MDSIKTFKYFGLSSFEKNEIIPVISFLLSGSALPSSSDFAVVVSAESGSGIGFWVVSGDSSVSGTGTSVSVSVGAKTEQN